MENQTTKRTDLSLNEGPLVNWLNNLLRSAASQGASDIHFEPYEKYYRIRFRQDGILYEHESPAPHLAARLTARLKVLAQLDIAERRLPQDGRFSLHFPDLQNRNVDFRLSSCPTLFGEKMVLRLLDPLHSQLEMDNLGLEDFQKNLFLKALNQPQGMILVTGPTGSGKTVTLYTALKYLNTETRNISSCEDPIEINLPGINQVNVNPKTGLSFANILRAFLRQDPDVMMVGEIRDLETAEIAIQAAHTGHLVLSTLHTNSAIASLTRFINMGIPKFNLASTISLIIAQRLARRLCEHCKLPASIPANALVDLGFSKNELSDIKLFGPKGCSHCKMGYRGRTGIYEILPFSNALATLLMQDAPETTLLAKACQEGLCLLKSSALHKVKQGIIGLAEYSRVIQDA